MEQLKAVDLPPALGLYSWTPRTTLGTSWLRGPVELLWVLSPRCSWRERLILSKSDVCVVMETKELGIVIDGP